MSLSDLRLVNQATILPHRPHDRTLGLSDILNEPVKPAICCLRWGTSRLGFRAESTFPITLKGDFEGKLPHAVQLL